MSDDVNVSDVTQVDSDTGSGSFLSDLGADASTAWDVVRIGAHALNPIYGAEADLASGDPAAATKTLVDATARAADNVTAGASKAVAFFNFITNPWVLGGAAVVVTLAIAGPYVLPFLPRRS